MIELTIDEVHEALLENYDPDNAERPYGDSWVERSLAEAYRDALHPTAILVYDDYAGHLLIEGDRVVARGEAFSDVLARYHAEMPEVYQISLAFGIVSPGKTYRRTYEKVN